MEQKPGGTPNPLNPNPGATMATGTTENVDNVKPTSTSNKIQPAPTATSVTEPTEKLNPVVNPTPISASTATRMQKPAPKPMPRTAPRPDIVPPRPVAQKPNGAPRPTPPAETATLDANPADPLMGVITSIDGVRPEQTSLDPMNRPMEKAPTPEAPKPRKKNIGLIVGMIICLFIAVCCGVAAALLFANSNKTDPLASAVEKIVSGNAPSNIKIDGIATIDVKDMGSPFSNMKINLKAEAVTRSMINSASASLNANLRNGGSFSIDFNEVYAANGDFYFKIDGTKKLLEDPYLFQPRVVEGDMEQIETPAPDNTTSDNAMTEELLDETIDETTLSENCSSEENCVTYNPGASIGESFMVALSTALSTIDNEWVRISTDELDSFGSDMKSENSVICMKDLVSGASKNSNTVSEIYKKNPFIVSATEGITITSKNNPIYKVTIDSENFGNFLNELKSSPAANDIASCMGQESSELEIDEFLEEMQNLPEIYVEIDENYDFTRLYLQSNSNDDADITIDLNLSYPANVNVSEPVEYKDLSTIMQQTPEETSNTGEEKTE